MVIIIEASAEPRVARKPIAAQKPMRTLNIHFPRKYRHTIVTEPSRAAGSRTAKLLCPNMLLKNHISQATIGGLL